MKYATRSQSKTVRNVLRRSRGLRRLAAFFVATGDGVASEELVTFHLLPVCALTTERRNRSQR